MNNFCYHGIIIIFYNISKIIKDLCDNSINLSTFLEAISSKASFNSYSVIEAHTLTFILLLNHLLTLSKYSIANVATFKDEKLLCIGLYRNENTFGLFKVKKL